jgi:alpha-glucosidase
VSLIEYRRIGGTLDFYFFSGPSPQKVIEQYGELVGLPTWQPAFGFGFHLCRWGYKNISDNKDQVAKMREANIPLEGQICIPVLSELTLTFMLVMWSDIDLYHAFRDFTTDPVSFPENEMRAYIKDLVKILILTFLLSEGLIF